MKKSKSDKRINLSDKLVVKEREEGWNDRIHRGIPEYRAENDRYCPRAQVRSYNEGNKMKAKVLDSQSKITSKWVDAALRSKAEVVPLKLKPSLRAQAVGSVNAKGESLAEVEILEKIIVRENLLIELHKLIENQLEVINCVNEVVELVKAIRFQTVDIIEDIDAWVTVQISIRSFLFRGTNYLLKILTDLDFLDRYEDIIEKFCFEFTGNPLGYRGGGELISRLGQMTFNDGTKTNNTNNKMSSYANEKGSVDGIEIVRLRNAEKVIQREVERLNKENSLLNQYTPVVKVEPPPELLPYPPLILTKDGSKPQHHGSGSVGGSSGAQGGDPYAGIKTESYGHLNNSIIKNQIQDFTQVHNTNQQRLEKGKLSQAPTVDDYETFKSKFDKIGKEPKSSKFKLKINPKKMKMERIATLTEECNELRAMQAHIDDQINVLVDDHKNLMEKKFKLDKKRQEAVSLAREAAANHIAVEISITINEIQDISNKVKDLQRQSYFINLERIRKKQIAQKLNKDLEDEKQRSSIQQKIAAKIKEGGILAALKTLNKVSMTKFKGNVLQTGNAEESGISEQKLLEMMDSLSPGKQGGHSLTEGAFNASVESFHTQYFKDHMESETDINGGGESMADGDGNSNEFMSEKSRRNQDYINNMMFSQNDFGQSEQGSADISKIEDAAGSHKFNWESSEIGNSDFQTFSKDYSSYRDYNARLLGKTGENDNESDAAGQNTFNMTEFERQHIYNPSNDDYSSNRNTYNFVDEASCYDETNFQDGDRNEYNNGTVDLDDPSQFGSYNFDYNYGNSGGMDGQMYSEGQFQDQDEDDGAGSGLGDHAAGSALNVIRSRRNVE